MAKRFIETVSTGVITDNQTGKEYNCEMRIDDDFLNLVNIIVNENEELKSALNELKKIGDYQYSRINELSEENEELKQFIKELTTKGTGRIDLASGYSYNVSAVLTDYRCDLE